MFKRLVAVITIISLYLLLPGAVGRARTITPLTTRATAKEKRPACVPCGQGSSPAASVDNLATLGRRTQPIPFAPLSRTVFEGAMVNFVSTATGHLAFSVTDLSLSGTMPITFQRIYASDRSADTGLGAGWSFAFDDRLVLNGNTALLTTAAGSALGFQRDGESQHFSLKTSEPTPHQSFSVIDGDTIVEEAGGMTRTYRKFGDVFRLSQIADGNGNKITISLDARGNLARIANDSGSALALEWSEGRDARLLSVADSAGQRVSFRQDGRRLRAATDSSGAQLTYDYEDGRLTRAADPAGRIVLRAHYDKTGRIAEAGDAVGMSLYQYDSASGISRRTVVTDPVGVKTIYEHTGRGLLTAVTDDEGSSARIEYNAANRPVRTSNSSGDEVSLSYDAQNRLLRQTATDGTDIAYTYDEQGRVSSLTDGGVRTEYTRDARGNIVAAKSSDPSKSYSATLNARGQAVALKSGQGRELSAEYDAAGNETVFAFSDVGRFETGRDAAGRIVSERFPSGLSQRYAYDSRGRTVKQSDNRGRSLAFERDASGALTGLVTPQGKWIRATRDDVGRIVALTNSAGKSRRFTYDARGALTDYVDARGKRKHVGYDRGGRVHDITDSDGNQVSIERDARGRPQIISSSDGTSLRYNYDRSGNLVSVRQEGVRKGSTARLMGASFEHLAAIVSPAAPAQFSDGCFFGYDGFYDGFGWDSVGWNDSFGSFGYNPLDQAFGSGNCSDPFGGCDWNGGFDSWYTDPWSSSTCSSFDGVSCTQCTARQIQICVGRAHACGLKVIAAVFGGTAPCIVIGIATAGLGILFCLAMLGGTAASLQLACNSEYQTCLLEAPDKCPQCG